jgi:hypothetical protein
MTLTFQIVHYVPNLFVGGRMPVAAMLLGTAMSARLVRALHLPDERCLGGHGHLAALDFALARLERDPKVASTAVLGPHLEFDHPRQVPAGVDADRWLREHVLPQPPAQPGTRGTRRATYGYAWLKAAGIARFVRKKFRPEKPGTPEVPALLSKGLKPISHWVTDGKQLLLLEPVIPRDLPLPLEDIATTLGAYRFHLGDEPTVTLGVYMLPGGSPLARVHARRSLQSSAHRVFDTETDTDRNALVSEVRLLGERNSPPLLH